MTLSRLLQWTGLTLLAVLVWPHLAAAAAPAASDWPRFRGPAGTGVCDQPGTPSQWSTASVLWKAPLKGKGQSSPVILGDRIFLTTALNDGHDRVVFCVDRSTGKTIWEQTAWTGTPERIHDMNSWATATCCTDGEHVWASFGMAGVHCYTLDGQHVWSQELGRFQSKTQRGTAASPVVVGNLLIFNGDSESDPFLFGLDKLTGKTVWKTDRPRAEGYSTPILVTAAAAGGAARQELVLNGDPYVAGYDPRRGNSSGRARVLPVGASQCPPLARMRSSL